MLHHFLLLSVLVSPSYAVISDSSPVESVSGVRNQGSLFVALISLLGGEEINQPNGQPIRLLSLTRNHRLYPMEYSK